MIAKRVYDFKLPYTIGAFKIKFGLGQLKSSGVFDLLPTKFQQMLEQAAKGFKSLTVTEAELNELSEDAWIKIADKLKLPWHYV